MEKKYTNKFPPLDRSCESYVDRVTNGAKPTIDPNSERAADEIAAKDGIAESKRPAERGGR